MLLYNSVIFILLFINGCLSNVAVNEFLVSNKIEDIYSAVPLNITKLHMLKNYNKTKSFSLLYTKLETSEVKKLNVLYNVEWIYLAYNNFCCDFDFQWLIECQNLNYLHLDHNKLRYISNTIPTFRYFPKLIVIDLSYNDFYYMSIVYFQKMPQLRKVVLSHNKLAHIDSFSIATNIIPLVYLIAIDDNFLTCDSLLNMIGLDKKYNTTALNFRWYSIENIVNNCSESSSIAITKHGQLCCRHPENVNSKLLQLDYATLMNLLAIQSSPNFKDGVINDTNLQPFNPTVFATIEPISKGGG